MSTVSYMHIYILVHNFQGFLGSIVNRAMIYARPNRPGRVCIYTQLCIYTWLCIYTIVQNFQRFLKPIVNKAIKTGPGKTFSDF